MIESIIQIMEKPHGLSLPEPHVTRGNLNIRKQ